MNIRKIKSSEYCDLINLMNLSFNFKKKEEQFESILPKLYYPSNKNNVHLGLFINHKLAASIGLYPMVFTSSYSSIKLIYIGGVATHPNYRNKGYFTLLMKEAIKYIKDNKYDLIILGGNRTRYNHFDFENCGIQFIFNLSRRKIKQLNVKKYSVKPLNKNNKKDIKCCLDIYLSSSQHNNRTVNNFYLHLLSWKAKPYVIYSSNKVVGYFTKRNIDILEIGYLKGYKDTLFKAILSFDNNARIFTSLDEYNKDTLSKCDSFNIEHCGMSYIINYHNIYKYLNIPAKEYKKASVLSRKDRVRYLLGDGVTYSSSFMPLYIPYQDHC